MNLASLTIIRESIKLDNSICRLKKIRYTAGMKMKTLTVVTISAIAFAACTPPPPKPADNLNLSFGQTNQSQPATSPVSQNQTNTPQKGLSMKTMQDFEKIEATQAAIMTTKGEIVFSLDKDKAPLTVANFLNLVKQGFYNGIRF